MLERAEAISGPNHPRVIPVLIFLADIYAHTQRATLAEGLYRYEAGRNDITGLPCTLGAKFYGVSVYRYVGCNLLAQVSAVKFKTITPFSMLNAGCTLQGQQQPATQEANMPPHWRAPQRFFHVQESGQAIVPQPNSWLHQLDSAPAPIPGPQQP